MALPRDISADGWRIDELVMVSSWMIAALALAGTLYLIGALLVYRKRRGRAAPLPGSPRRPALIPLTVAGALFFGVDGYLFYRSARDLGPLLDAPAGALRVEINAHQWAWEFRYAGPDGSFATADDILSTNELVVPLGVPVALQIASSDVVHAFHLPNLRVKRDAVPGHINHAHFTAVELGGFEIACAQFCGVQHYKMRGRLTVLGAGDFADWLARSAADSLRMLQEEERARSEAAALGEGAHTTSARSLPGRDWGWAWQ